MAEVARLEEASLSFDVGDATPEAAFKTQLQYIEASAIQAAKAIATDAKAAAAASEEPTATAATAGNNTEFWQQHASRSEELDLEEREPGVRMEKAKLYERQLQLGNYEVAELLLGEITRQIRV